MMNWLNRWIEGLGRIGWQVVFVLVCNWQGDFSRQKARVKPI